MRVTRDMLDEAAAETGWTDESKVDVLLGFVDGEAADDPLLKERFRRYLDERVEVELGEVAAPITCPACGSAAWGFRVNDRAHCLACGHEWTRAVADDPEPEVDDEPPPDYGPPGTGAVVTEYTGAEPGLEDF